MKFPQQTPCKGNIIHSNPNNLSPTAMPFDFGIKDAIDILLVALLLYNIYRLMKDSGSLNIFYGILIFFGLWVVVSQMFQMRLLGSIFDKLISVGALALIILFQDDIRRFFITIGTHRKFNILARMFKFKEKDQGSDPVVMPIVRACMDMSRNKVGALIVVERNMALSDIISTGELIDARVNQSLIENIFFKNSPLHDGAMVISKKRIAAAGCVLPVSHNISIPKELGLRHRAALGITEQSDALAVIVSEETGGISIAQRGVYDLRLQADKLEEYLTTAMNEKPHNTKEKVDH